MISIIIINYHTQELIVDCLNSLFKYHEEENIEVIVVNNGGSTRLLNTLPYSSKIKIINAPSNVGFGRANNLGFQESSGDTILYLNSDTLFEESVLSEMESELKANPTIGIISCRLLYQDHSEQINYHDGNHFFQKLKWRNPIAIKLFKGSVKSVNSKNLSRSKQSENHFCDWLSGAILMLRRKNIEENNWLWDEDFFMYWEDVELCNRIRKSGFKIFYFNDKYIIHIGGGGEDVPAKRSKQLLLSEWLCILKCLGKLQLIRYFVIWRFTMTLDSWLYYKSKMLKRLTESDKMDRARRIEALKLFRKSFITLIFKYSSKTNSNKSFLK